MVETIFFYLDGVGYKFLENMKFLKNIGQKGSLSKVSVEPLHQMEFSIFSSQLQKEINYWTWYYYNPKTSLYSWTKIVPAFFDNYLFKKIINYITVLKEYLRGNTHMIPIGDIPLNFLKYFDLTSKKSFIDKNPTSIDTLFDVLRKNGISYYAYEWPISSTEKGTYLDITKKDDSQFLKKILKHKKKKFLFVHLTVFDGILHNRGSQNSKVKKYLIELDKKIEDAYKELLKENPNLNIFAASDHGMVDVHSEINVLNALEKRNVIYFIDSTCLRVWGDKEEIGKIRLSLKKLPGKIYTEENKKQCPIKFKREYSGDLLFVAEKGYEISPNFFNTRLIKAMHGYDKTKELDALFISNKKSTNKKRISVIDICPIILKMIEIEKPNIWKGSS